MSDTSGGTPPGWYADSQGTLRWWDGSAWTAQTRPDGPPAPTGEQPAAEDPTRVRPRPLLGDDGQPLDPAAGASAPGQPGAYPPPGGQFQPGAPGAPGAPGGPGAPGTPPQQPAWAGMPMNPMPPTGSGPGGGGKNRTVLFAAIGGGVVLLIVVVVVLALALGGGDDDAAVGDGAGSGSGGATATAEAFADAIAEQDYVRACELTTSDAREEALSQADAEACSDLTAEAVGGAELSELTEDIEVTTEVGDVEEDGDTATAEITLTTSYAGDDETLAEGFGDVPATTLTLELVQEDGDWLVSDAS